MMTKTICQVSKDITCFAMVANAVSTTTRSTHSVRLALAPALKRKAQHEGCERMKRPPMPAERR